MSAERAPERLGNLLVPVERAESVDPSRIYRLLGARWYAQGLFVKDEKSGQSIKANTLYRVNSGDFVYNRLFAWKGSFAIADADVNGCYVSNEFPCFDVNRARLSPSYLKWWFSRESAWLQALGLSNGATPTSRNRLKEERLLGMEIPLPPIDEQRRIVARIEELARKIEESKGLRQQGIVSSSALFGRRIAEVFTQQTSKLWKLGTLGDYVIDDCYGTSEKTNDDLRGTPILRMGNIQDGRLINRPLKYLQISPKEREKLILKPNDILVNRTNSAELVGKCAVFDLDGEYGFASYLIRLRLDQTRCIPRLVAAYINSPIGRSYMFGEKKQMTGQANVNATTLKKLPLPLPDIHEQADILAEFDALQTRIVATKHLQTETARELDAMLPAILDRAFKGGL